MPRIISILILAALTIKTVCAGQMEHMMACHDLLPQDQKQLSPIRGMALLDSPVLSNLRFVGMYGPESAVPENIPYKQYDQLTRKKDHGLTATASLIQYLFPSPTDAFAITGRGSFLYRKLGMSGLADLTTKLDYFCDAPQGHKELEVFLRGKITGKATRKELSKDFSVYTRMLLDAVQEARDSAYSLSPHFVQDLIGAYAAELSRRVPQYDFGDYLETLAPGSKARAGDYTSLTKQRYLDWKTQLRPQSIISPDQTAKLKEDPVWAYQISRAIFQYEALPIQIPYRTAFVDGVEFSDCCESGLRGLILFLLYDPDKNCLDLSRLPVSAAPEFKAFFDNYDPRRPEQFHTKWAVLLANRVDPLIRYKKDTDKTRCEIESGIPNCLRVLAEVLGDPKLIDESLTLLERVKHLEARFSKGDDRYEVLNEDDFKQAGQLTQIELGTHVVSFTLKSDPGHTGVEYSNANADLRPAFDREELVQMTGVYIPLYANLFPDLCCATATRFNHFNLEHRDYAYKEKRKKLFGVLDPRTAVHFILSAPLESTEAKVSYISLIADLNLLEANRQFPSLNHRISLCDPYSNLRIFDALSRFGQALSEQVFPHLWNRIDRSIHEKPIDHIENLLSGELTPAAEHRQLWDLCFSKSVLDKILERISDPEILLSLAEVIGWYGTNLERKGYFEILIRTFESVLPQMLTIQYEPYAHERTMIRGSFASKLLTFSDNNSEIAIRLLDLLSDVDFQAACYQISNECVYFFEQFNSNSDVVFGAEPQHSQEVWASTSIDYFLSSGHSETIAVYALKRLLRIDPVRLKNLKTHAGTILNTRMASIKYYRPFQETSHPSIRLLVDTFRHDRDWILSPDWQGKRFWQRFRDVDGSLSGDGVYLFEAYFDDISDLELLRDLLVKSLSDQRLSSVQKLISVIKIQAPEILQDPKLQNKLESVL